MLSWDHVWIVFFTLISCWYQVFWREAGTCLLFGENIPWKSTILDIYGRIRWLVGSLRNFCYHIMCTDKINHVCRDHKILVRGILCLSIYGVSLAYSRGVSAFFALHYFSIFLIRIDNYLNLVSLYLLLCNFPLVHFLASNSATLLLYLLLKYSVS